MTPPTRCGRRRGCAAMTKTESARKPQLEPSWKAVGASVSLAVCSQSCYGYAAATTNWWGFFPLMLVTALTGGLATFILGWHACWGVSHLFGRKHVLVQVDPAWQLGKSLLAAPDPEMDQCMMCGVTDLSHWRERGLTVQHMGHEVHMECRLLMTSAPVVKRLPLAPAGYATPRERRDVVKPPVTTVKQELQPSKKLIPLPESDKPYYRVKNTVKREPMATVDLRQVEPATTYLRQQIEAGILTVDGAIEQLREMGDVVEDHYLNLANYDRYSVEYAQGMKAVTEIRRELFDMYRERELGSSSYRDVLDTNGKRELYDQIIRSSASDAVAFMNGIIHHWTGLPYRSNEYCYTFHLIKETLYKQAKAKKNSQAGDQLRAKYVSVCNLIREVYPDGR